MVAQRAEFDRRLSKTALAWQANGNDADFAEMSAVVSRSEPGRMHIIIGRIASAGEQLGLAGLAYRDARAWLEKGGAGNDVRFSARALAEVVGYFALSAAHGVWQTLRPGCSRLSSGVEQSLPLGRSRAAASRHLTRRMRDGCPSTLGRSPRWRQLWFITSQPSRG